MDGCGNDNVVAAVVAVVAVVVSIDDVRVVDIVDNTFLRDEVGVDGRMSNDFEVEANNNTTTSNSSSNNHDLNRSISFGIILVFCNNII